MIGMTGKGSCRIRLSSERDSKCFTNDKYASSRTTLNIGQISTSGVAASTSRLPHTKINDYEPCRKLLADKAHPVRGRGTLNRINNDAASTFS